MAKTKSKKGNWIVTMRCVITKEVYITDCTEDEARANPWEHAQDEHEVDQIDWDILSVKAEE